MSIIDSRIGQIKKRLRAYGAQTAATTVDIPEDWDPNTKKEPTGLFFCRLRAAVFLRFLVRVA
jgi:hypothetical protein